MYSCAYSKGVNLGGGGMVGSGYPKMNKGYPLLSWYISSMTKSKDDLKNIEFSGKVKTQTFKQFQLERLIKDGTVIPASKLAEAKDMKLQRSRNF